MSSAPNLDSKHQKTSYPQQRSLTQQQLQHHHHHHHNQQQFYQHHHNLQRYDARCKELGNPMAQSHYQYYAGPVSYQSKIQAQEHPLDFHHYPLSNRLQEACNQSEPFMHPMSSGVVNSQPIKNRPASRTDSSCSDRLINLENRRAVARDFEDKKVSNLNYQVGSMKRQTHDNYTCLGPVDSSAASTNDLKSTSTL